MNRAVLANFLRTGRESLRPEDVGPIRGARRRTGGLRREEVADLAAVSADYHSRIEQQRGPMPSAQMLTALDVIHHLETDQARLPPRRRRTRIHPWLRRRIALT
jgi:transcriptional regulator with XRE-family HTH domain